MKAKLKFIFDFQDQAAKQAPARNPREGVLQYRKKERKLACYETMH